MSIDVPAHLTLCVLIVRLLYKGYTDCLVTSHLVERIVISCWNTQFGIVSNRHAGCWSAVRKCLGKNGISPVMSWNMYTDIDIFLNSLLVRVGIKSSPQDRKKTNVEMWRHIHEWFNQGLVRHTAPLTYQLCYLWSSRAYRLRSDASICSRQSIKTWHWHKDTANLAANLWHRKTRFL